MSLWHFKRREINRLQGRAGDYKQVNRGAELDAKHYVNFTPCVLLLRDGHCGCSYMTLQQNYCPLTDGELLREELNSKQCFTLVESFKSVPPLTEKPHLRITDKCWLVCSEVSCAQVRGHCCCDSTVALMPRFTDKIL